MYFSITNVYLQNGFYLCHAHSYHKHSSVWFLAGSCHLARATVGSEENDKSHICNVVFSGMQCNSGGGGCWGVGFNLLNLGSFFLISKSWGKGLGLCPNIGVTFKNSTPRLVQNINPISSNLRTIDNYNKRPTGPLKRSPQDQRLYIDILSGKEYDHIWISRQKVHHRMNKNQQWQMKSHITTP